MISNQFVSQAAKDAQTMNYGGQQYWEQLDESALRNAAYFVNREDYAQAKAMLTRSLGEALSGNNGD